MSAVEDRLPEVGSRARLLRVVERFPHFLIKEGATGRITEATESLIALRMDEFVPGAEEWDNELYWTQEDAEFAAVAGATAEQRIAAAFHEDAEIIESS